MSDRKKNPDSTGYRSLMGALRELEALDRRRENRKALERKRVQTPPREIENMENESAARAPQQPEEDGQPEETAPDEKAQQPAEDKPVQEPPSPEKIPDTAQRVPRHERDLEIPEPPKDDPLNQTNKYRELCKKPSMTVKSDDLAVMNEFSEVIGSVSEAANLLEEFVKEYPDVIPEQKLRIWDDNLRETASIMFREFHQLRHGKQNKVYDKKYICKECKSVFMVPLPENICDECRSKQLPRSSDY